MNKYDRSAFPWEVVIFVGAVIAFVALVVLIVVSGEQAYDQRCRERGGHVVTVRSSEVCVNESDKIILI